MDYGWMDVYTNAEGCPMSNDDVIMKMFDLSIKCHLIKTMLTTPTRPLT